MKKIIAILVALVLVFSLSVTAFAANGAFYESPSNKGPQLVTGENKDDNCSGKVIVTNYSDRNNLSVNDKSNIEEAYKQIAGTKDLTKLAEDLTNMAKDLGIDPSLLQVSDLFFVNYTGCTEHENHSAFDITLDADLLADFVSLICFHDGKWHVIKDAKVVNNGEHLVFAAENFSTYAIVVNSDIPKTGDAGVNPVWFVVMAASVVGLVALCIVMKKGQRNEEN